MAYMKDADGNRLDTFAVEDASNAGTLVALNRMARREAINAATPYVLIVGQSNAQGWGVPYNAGIDVPLEGLGNRAGGGVHAGTVSQASDPLYHVGQVFAPDGTPRVGPGMEFARQWITSEIPYSNVVLIPAAQGSTSFTGNSTYSWDPDNVAAASNLFTRSVSVTTNALAADSTGYLAAVIISLVESDVALGASKAWYKAKLLQMIDSYRTSFGPAPVLILSMTPEWKAATGAAAIALDAAQQEIATERPLVAYVAGPADMNQDSLIHYSARGARESGRRLYAAYQTLDASRTLDGSTGALIKINAASIPAGVPVSGTVTNLAAATATTITGGSTVHPAVTLVGTPSFTERTKKGGLHVYTATASTEYRLSWPADIVTYLQANHTHKFFVNVWADTSVVPTLAENAFSLVDIGTPAQFGINVRGASVRPDTTDKEFAGSTFMVKGLTCFTGLIDPADISGTLNTLRGMWRIATGHGGHVLYRLDIIDQNIDTRTYKQLHDAARSDFNRAFFGQGAYARDVRASPAV